VAAGCSGLASQEEALFKSLKIPAAFPLIDEMTHQERPFGCNLQSANPIARTILDTFQLQSALMVPVIHAQQLYGMLLVACDHTARELGEDDLALLTSVAAQARLGLLRSEDFLARADSREARPQGGQARLVPR